MQGVIVLMLFYFFWQNVKKCHKKHGTMQGYYAQRYAHKF